MKCKSQFIQAGLVLGLAMSICGTIALRLVVQCSDFGHDQSSGMQIPPSK